MQISGRRSEHGTPRYYRRGGFQFYLNNLDGPRPVGGIDLFIGGSNGWVGVEFRETEILRILELGFVGMYIGEVW